MVSCVSNVQVRQVFSSCQSVLRLTQTLPLAQISGLVLYNWMILMIRLMFYVLVVRKCFNFICSNKGIWQIIVLFKSKVQHPPPPPTGPFYAFVVLGGEEFGHYCYVYHTYGVRNLNSSLYFVLHAPVSEPGLINHGRGDMPDMRFAMLSLTILKENFSFLW